MPVSSSSRATSSQSDGKEEERKGWRCMRKGSKKGVVWVIQGFETWAENLGYSSTHQYISCS